MNNTLGRSLINRRGCRGQLHIGVLRISGDGSVKLLDGGTQTTLHDAVAEILFFADLDAFLCGLDIRQLGSPPP